MQNNQGSSKSGCNAFLTNRDMFLNPINLTYNYKKNYPTPYGGFMTIISGTVILIWLSLQIY